VLVVVAEVAGDVVHVEPGGVGDDPVDDAHEHVAGGQQQAGGGLPGGGAEYVAVAAVQQQDRAAVFDEGGDVDEGHAVGAGADQQLPQQLVGDGGAGHGSS
jgi:hypothetical protein